jgi:hypothetical protein
MRLELATPIAQQAMMLDQIQAMNCQAGVMPRTMADLGLLFGRLLGWINFAARWRS